MFRDLCKNEEDNDIGKMLYDQLKVEGKLRKKTNREHFKRKGVRRRRYKSTKELTQETDTA